MSSINSIVHGKNSNKPIDEISHNGVNIRDPIAIGNVFNEFFTSVGLKTQNSIPQDYPTHSFDQYLKSPNPNSFYLNFTNREEILRIIYGLKNSSPGFDEIPARVVKTVAHVICDPLVYVFNLSLEQGTFPAALKIARVIPVYKKDNATSVTNYRPISVLPCFSKILEKLMFERVYSFLVNYPV